MADIPSSVWWKPSGGWDSDWMQRIGKMKHDLIYYFPWYRFTREQMPAMIRECQDWGIRRFVFTNELVQKCMEDPSWIAYLHNLERSFGDRKSVV